ncbi:MAG: hypothetical protein QM808_02365 [Steroidobacteraceae bacterium]
MKQAMNKTVVKAVAQAFTVGLLLAGSVAQAAGVADMVGFWQPVKKIETLKTSAGQTPPLNAAGKEAYQANLDAAKEGDRSFDIERKCLPLGLTRLLAESPFEFMVAKKEAGLIFEWNRVVHMINLRDKHEREKYEAQYAYPYYNGHSIGYAKGNTFVIDSIYFNEDNTLDKSGLPHSEDLHVTQTLQLKDANTLESTLTIEDKQYYSKPWQTKLTFTRLPAGATLKEDVCTERMGLKKLDTEK